MKKLCTKGKIHPSSPPANISDHLSLLPPTILTLAVALPPQDRQVLAYLISCSGYSSNNFSGHHKGRPKRDVSAGGDHPPEFACSCFRCYMSYWVRWDNSPNREIIHEILDAYEEGLLQNKNYNYVKNRKGRRKRNSNSNPSADAERKGELKENKLVEVSFQGDVEEMRGEEELGKGSSVRKIVSFLGERVWGVWGI